LASSAGHRPDPGIGNDCRNIHTGRVAWAYAVGAVTEWFAALWEWAVTVPRCQRRQGASRFADDPEFVR
jgi:hypothetical protein